MDIQVNTDTVIPAREVWFEFSHATGPGGQNVNKVSTRATLCFSVNHSGALHESQKRRLYQALRNRIDKDGVLRIHAGDQRSQTRNRAAAVERFRDLLANALRPRKRRVATRPSRGAKERRLKAKRIRSDLKKNRQSPRPGEDA